MKQLTIDDVMGSFDYNAISTSEKFLNPSYEVHFYDKEERQKWIVLMLKLKPTLGMQQ